MESNRRDNGLDDNANGQNKVAEFSGRPVLSAPARLMPHLNVPLPALMVRAQLGICLWPRCLSQQKSAQPIDFN